MKWHQIKQPEIVGGLIAIKINQKLKKKIM